MRGFGRPLKTFKAFMPSPYREQRATGREVRQREDPEEQRCAGGSRDQVGLGSNRAGAPGGCPPASSLTLSEGSKREGVSHVKIQTTDAVPTVFLTKAN